MAPQRARSNTGSHHSGRPSFRPHPEQLRREQRVAAKRAARAYALMPKALQWQRSATILHLVRALGALELLDPSNKTVANHASIKASALVSDAFAAAGFVAFCNAFHYRDLAPIFARRRFCCIKRRCGAAYVVSIATMYLSPCSIACHYMQLYGGLIRVLRFAAPSFLSCIFFSFRRLSLARVS